MCVCVCVCLCVCVYVCGYVGVCVNEWMTFTYCLKLLFYSVL